LAKLAKHVHTHETVIGDVDKQFTLWNIKFDVELKEAAPMLAWRTLTDHKCDPQTLKSALYHAAVHLDGAQELSTRWTQYLAIRQTAFDHLSELKKTFQQLMALKFRSDEFMDQLFFFYGVKKREVVFFERFPELLERFESMLKVLKVQTTKRHSLRAMLTAAGESLLHIYVEAFTDEDFPEEVAVLLEAGAEAYGLSGPSYSTAAVRRRYKRFREKYHRTYEVNRRLVRQFRSQGGAGTDLSSFVDAEITKGHYSLVMDYLDKYVG
jgi:hypothetical protein